MKKPIIGYEIFEPTKTIIKEAIGGSDIMIVEGILTTVDKVNKNGRIYPRKIFEREVNKYIKEFVNEKRAYGELDHPESTVVEGKNTSHVITDIWWEGSNVMGRLEIFDDNPAGRIVRNILKRGYRLGISSRGVGSTRKINEEAYEVGNDYELICWDFVTNPSNHNSFMNPVKENTLIESTYKSILTEEKSRHVDELFYNIFCQWNQRCGLR